MPHKILENGERVRSSVDPDPQIETRVLRENEGRQLIRTPKGYQIKRDGTFLADIETQYSSGSQDTLNIFGLWNNGVEREEEEKRNEPNLLGKYGTTDFRDIEYAYAFIHHIHEQPHFIRKLNFIVNEHETPEIAKLFKRKFKSEWLVHLKKPYDETKDGTVIIRSPEFLPLTLTDEPILYGLTTALSWYRIYEMGFSEHVVYFKFTRGHIPEGMKKIEFFKNTTTGDEDDDEDFEDSEVAWIRIM